MGKKDNIFRKPLTAKDFSFDASVTKAFDDMLGRSIPLYSEIQNMVGDIAKHFAKGKTNIYDLGCSTGNTLTKLKKAIKQKTVRFIGVDNSLPMINKAKEKMNKFPDKRVKFIKGDIVKNIKIQNASVVILNWTFQFIRPIHRNLLIKKIYKGLTSGGCLIVNEKILSNDPILNRIFISLYYNFKKRNKYSELEISRKREALENVLVPYGAEENIEILKKNGFKHVDIFFKWHNFAGFLAVKTNR